MSEAGERTKATKPKRAPPLPPDHAKQKITAQSGNEEPTHAHQLPMVGLGGSAGSIQALQTFFRAMPPDSGLAFVVVMHLSTEHESALAEVVQSWTAMRVEQVRDTIKVQPNRVYVIPPGKQLGTADGHLRLQDLPSERGRRVAVDLFFRTLADTHGPHGAAIVLSGADGDGAIGIKRVKERGGLTIAQDPNEAQHPSMPEEAIATGMVDWVLQVADMPERLVKYYESAQQIKLPHEDGPALDDPAPALPRQSIAEAEAALRDVLVFLAGRTGRDFSYYKRATILRRIGRRMQITGMNDLPAYLTFLRADADETAALLQDMLISVTNFFRDRDAFDELTRQVPALFRDKGPSDQVRVWVAGCATGEEAYSIAMLLYEHARTLEAPPQIQVFATDIAEAAIRSAREGAYPAIIAADVSEERLRRWFVKELHGYRVRREIREIVLFALHDALKDAPFSRLDLVSCRNLLIYLKSDAQSRLFDTFHFALRTNGRLFLGSSESLDANTALFTPIDKRHRIYEAKPTVRDRLPVPVGTSLLAQTVHAGGIAGQRPAFPRQNEDADALARSQLKVAVNRNATKASELHYRLIERFGPPSAVVNADYQIVHMSNAVGRLLQFTGGEPTQNLLQLVHPMLRLDLRAALFTAMHSRMPAGQSDLPLELEGKRLKVGIQVAPANDLGQDYLLVLFQIREEGIPEDTEQPAEPQPADNELKRQLEKTRAQLRDTVEQSEASTEELRASNEELQAINEELRSATEELETSREELQSINEELGTVNLELKNKVEELGRANSDLHVLMGANAIATIFLDRELRIMRYTPSAVDLFNLIHTDIGRPLSDLTHRLDYPEMERDARRALGELMPAEREVQAAGRWFLARTLPYRASDERIGGVVFSFIDITARRAAEHALRELQQEQAADLAAMLRLQELSSRLLSATDLPPLLAQFVDATIDLQKGDFGTAQLYDRTSRTLEMVVQRGFDTAFLDHFNKIQIDDPAPASARALKRRTRVIVADVNLDPVYEPLREAAAAAGYQALQATPLVDRNDEPVGVLATYFREPHQPTARELRLVDLYARQAADVISFKLSEQTLRESEERFRAIVEQTALGVAQIDFSGRIVFANYRLTEILGRTREDVQSLSVQELMRADDLAENEQSFTRLKREGLPFETETHLLRADGQPVPVSISASVLRDRHGRPVSASVLVLDLTERNMARQASRTSEERLRLVVENAREYAIFSTDLQRQVISWNPGAQRLLGYGEKEVIGQSADVIFTPEDRAAGVPEAEAHTALAEGRAADERWHLRKNGSRFFGSGVMMAMRDADGETIGLIKILRDQTQAREAAEALARSRTELEQALAANKIAREELETASRAKDRFLAVLSHELRTPLTPVVMAVQLLARRTDLPKPARDTIEVIRRNVKVESHLIDDLLDLTRISRGHLEIAAEPMDMHEAIAEAIEICESDVRGKGQTLTVALEASEHQVDGDFSRLQQVVWNLLQNASKFTRHRGDIRLATRSEDGRFFMCISDNGIGIEPTVLSTIFDAFSQGGEWVSREYGGLGLGLAISKATIEAHGGSIKAESEGRGQGATFTVELPLGNR